jgi:hypothetical protein
MEIKVGYVNEGFLDEETMEFEVSYPSDGWDKMSKWRMDLKAAAKLENDMIVEEVRDTLLPLGYEVNDRGHIFNEDDETITFKIRKK